MDDEFGCGSDFGEGLDVFGGWIVVCFLREVRLTLKEKV